MTIAERKNILSAEIPQSVTNRNRHKCVCS